MPDLSPNLELPYLLPSQAQKHVTHNEALERLDLLAQLTVQRFDAETPPATPPEGRIWALGPAPTGDWAGQAGRLATFLGGAWAFLEPREGWRAWGLAESGLRVWRGTAWAPLSLDDLAGLGIGTTYDGTNRLAVVSPATLFNHAGSDHRLKINKAAAGDTAALLFQTDWEGRAEIGLTGDDDFSLKVSADGSAWSEALKVSRSNGAADLAAGLKVDGHAVYHRGNILGPVTQAAGQPTGAVIEHGNNANGEYVRLADGTQICWREFNAGSVIANGAGTFANPYHTSSLTLSFAANFVAAPAVAFAFKVSGSISVVDRIIVPAGYNIGTGSITSFRAARVAGSSADADVLGDMIAVGRWF